MSGIVWVMLWCDMQWGNGPGGACRLPEQWTTVAQTRLSRPLFTSREACQQDELNIINEEFRRRQSMPPADPDRAIAGGAPSPDQVPPKFDESGRLYSGPDHSRWGECKEMGVYDKPINNYQP
jgi:hypothetical protein